MVKNSKKAGYIYCLILIVISIVIIARTEVLSRIFMDTIKDRAIPLTVCVDDIKSEYLSAIFPVLGMYEGEPEENFSTECEYQEYVWNDDLQAEVQQVGIATETDGSILAGQMNSDSDMVNGNAVAETLGQPFTEFYH